MRNQIEINATLPAVNGIEKIKEVLSWFPGCRVAKIKVGDIFEEDLERIKLAQAIIPDLQIRLDVNGRWTVTEARTYLHAINAHASHIQYVEQPCATIEELRELKRTLDLPLLIAGDEIIRKAADPFALDLAGAVDIVMLKVAPLGGIQRSLQLAAHHNLPVVVSSALDSAIGISRGLQLAGALPDLPYACGLGTGSLLSVDLAEFPIREGVIAIAPVRPSNRVLNEFTAAKDRVLWWKERISKTWAVGVEKERWSE
jgi:O-succinylbenzoate synthase